MLKTFIVLLIELLSNSQEAKTAKTNLNKL